MKTWRRLVLLLQELRMHLLALARRSPGIPNRVDRSLQVLAQVLVRMISLLCQPHHPHPHVGIELTPNGLLYHKNVLPQTKTNLTRNERNCHRILQGRLLVSYLTYIQTQKFGGLVKSKTLFSLSLFLC